MCLEGGARLIVKLEGVESAHNLTFLVSAPECFHCNQLSFNFDKLQRSGTPLVVPLSFKVLNNILCSNLNGRITFVFEKGWSAVLGMQIWVEPG